jgi:NAD(P)-dependent dehydrogenase (short-subunit alcohol dehydrogenase family)
LRPPALAWCRPASTKLLMKARADRPSLYLVTGANRGIGLAFAREMSRRGDSVIATARHPEQARELKKLGVRVERLDVEDDESIAELAERIRGEPIDVLIHNAGIGQAGPGLERLPIKDLEHAFRVNAIGVVAVTQALLRNLRAGQAKKIIGLSSGLVSISHNEEGGWYAYRASKAAMNQLMRTMAREVFCEGFVCVLICPGWVRTDMGGRGAPLSAEESVEAMLHVIDRLEPSDNGRFLDRRGKQIPW